jgi:hypothetical protein
MKTKTFLLICLFLGIGLIQLSAQKGKNGNGSTSEYATVTGYYYIPVDCSKVVGDELVGSITEHAVRHYKDGVLIWQNSSYDGEVTNASTGEVFIVKDHWKWDSATPDSGSGHYTLKGSSGSHYILFYTFDFNTYTVTFTKAVCN